MKLNLDERKQLFGALRYAFTASTLEHMMLFELPCVSIISETLPTAKLL